MFVWRNVSTCWNSCTWVVGACVKLASWAAVVSQSTGDAGSGQTVGSPQYNQTGRLRRGDRYLFVDASRSPRWGQFLSEMVLLLFHNSRKLKEELNSFFGWGILTSSLLRGLCTQNYRITSPLILLPQTELNWVKHSECVYSICTYISIYVQSLGGFGHWQRHWEGRTLFAEVILKKLYKKKKFICDYAGGDTFEAEVGAWREIPLC